MSGHRLWFAWRPVRTGYFKDGRLVWLRKVWHTRACDGRTIYQTYWGA